MVKKFLAIALVALVVSPAVAMSLAEATKQITSIVNNPESIKVVMSGLNKEDQVTFLGRLNKAISKTRRSVDSKTAIFVAVNKTAFTVHKGNVKELLAETFATVPVSSLTAVNEVFAAELFNRSANPSRPYSDEQFKKRALSAVEIIVARNKGNGSDADVRNTFAMIMFLRSSKGTPADLADALVALIADPEIREIAKNDWIPAALGIGREPSYDLMVSFADGSSIEIPEYAKANNFLNTQGSTLLSGALLADLAPSVDAEGRPTTSFTSRFLDPDKYALPSDGTSGLNRIPRSLDKKDPWYPGHNRDDLPLTGEPGDYFGQQSGSSRL